MDIDNIEHDQEGFDKKQHHEQDSFDFMDIQLTGIPKNAKPRRIFHSQLSRFVITDDSKIFRWLIEEERGYSELELPERKEVSVSSALISAGLVAGKGKDKSIKNVFHDRNGYHTFFAGEGCLFYINYKENKIRFLTKLAGVSIRSMDFIVAYQDKCEVLAGSDNGHILKFGMDANVIRDDGTVSFLAPNVILKLGVSAEVNNLRLARTFNSNDISYTILLATANHTLFLYESIGKEEQALLRFKEMQPKEFKFNKGQVSILRSSVNRITGQTTSFIYTNGLQIYHFDITALPDKIAETAINNRKTLRFVHRYDIEERTADVKQPLVSIGNSQFHYVLLFQDGLTLVSKIDQKLIKFYDIKSPLSMTYCDQEQAFIVNAARSYHKLDLSSQYKDALGVLVQKKKFREAYNVSQALGQHVQFTANNYGDQEFDRRNFRKAAKIYASSSRSLEQILLKFLNSEHVQAIDGLITYILIWLNKLKPESERVQRTLLLSVMIQSLIFHMNYLDTQSRKQEIRKRQKYIQDQWLSLLKNYFQEMDENVIYQITLTHGRIKQCLDFARKKGNFKLIVMHHINMEQYPQALKCLREVSPKEATQIIYSFGHLFFSKQTKATTELLMDHIGDIKPNKLISGLMNVPESNYSDAVKLLTYCLRKQYSKDQSVNNFLLYFYSKIEEKPEDFLELLKKGTFDSEFALRIFQKSGYLEAQIVIYGLMEMYTEAVNLSLQNGFLELAKTYANMTLDEDLKKKLWLKVASFLLSERNGKVQNAIQLTREQNGVLKIQDLLPLFNQNIKIQDFKDEICESLKHYSQEIQSLKNEMNSYSDNAEQLKAQLKAIKNRSIEIDSTHKCEECFKSIFSEEFYIFPCLHGFHKTCFFNSYRHQPRVDIKEVQTLQTLEEQIRLLSNKINRVREGKESNQDTGFMSFLFSRKSQETSNSLTLQRDQEELQEKKQQFDGKLARECLYCGPKVVQSILAPFEDQQQRRSWQI